MLTKMIKNTRVIDDDGLSRIAQATEQGLQESSYEDDFELEASEDEDEDDEDKMSCAPKKAQASNVWDLYTQLEETIGIDELAMAMAKGMGTEKLEWLLGEIARDYDIGYEDEEDFGMEASKQAQEGTYEGWSNRATWLAGVWLDNDYGMYQAVNQAKEEASDVNDFVSQVKEILQNGISSDPNISSDFEDEDLYDINWKELVEHLMAE